MPVLRINGHTVPVLQGSLKVKPIEVGSRVMSYNNTAIFQRSNLKRTISFTTTPLSEMDAEALKGLIRGVGENWSFDGDANGTISASEFPAYLYSNKGVRPLTVGTSTAQQTSSVKYGAGSLDPDTVLTYPTCVLSDMTDVTINAWISAPDSSGNPSGHDDYILIAEDGSNNNVVRLMRGDSANDIQFYTRSNGGTAGTITYSTNPWTGTGNFHMVTAVLRNNPEGTEKFKELYFNGSSVASTTTATTGPTLSNITTFKVGNNGDASSTWPGYIDELMIVPYAATSDIVSAWHSMGKAMSSLPKVYIDGDVILDDLLTTEFIGHVNSSKFIYAGDEVKEIISVVLEET